MCESVTPALNALANVRPLEFWAIYNIEALGRAQVDLARSATMKIRHIQWSEGVAPGSEVSRTILDELRQVDIGIVPNAIPVHDRLAALAMTASDEREFMYEPFDYLLRFKASCNAARVYPFAQMGIPVVADFAPSASQLIRDGESGFLACSPYGWFEALDSLAASADLRNQLGQGLRVAVASEYDRQLDDFLDFCTKPLKTDRPFVSGVPTAEDELAHLKDYNRPRGPGRWEQIQRRFRRGFIRRAH
jgi:glycosyltransferase involved in cell wall biosynthesis